MAQYGIFRVSYVYKDGSKRVAEDLVIKANDLFTASEQFFDNTKDLDLIYASFDRVY